MTESSSGASDRTGRDFLRTYGIFLGIQLLVSILNINHVQEQGMYVHLIRDVAAYYRGELPVLESPTYPMWGFPAILAVLWSDTAMVVFQALFSALAVTMLYGALARRFPAHRRAIQVLLMAGLPWYTLNSVKWPTALGASTACIAFLLFVDAVERRSLRRAILAGLAMGVSLNIRSDPLLMTLAIPAVAVLLLLARRPVIPVRLAAAFGAIAWVTLIPWAVWYHHWTGAVGFTSSNKWWAAYSTLAQLPNNPWGVVQSDWWAVEFLAKKGYEGHPATHEADLIMKDAFIAAVREHPGPFARKIVRNITRLYLGGFYSGDPRFSPQQDTALDIVREKIKQRVGVNPNDVEIAYYQRTGMWDTLRPAPATVAALGYLVIMIIIGNLFIAASTAGIITARRLLVSDPLYLIGFLMIAYQAFMIMGILKYEPRFVNALYLYFAMFALTFWISASAWWRERRMRRASR